MTWPTMILVGLACVVAGPAVAQQNRVDAVTPLAPELAAYGPLAIGVRTITATDRNRVDVLNTKDGEDPRRIDIGHVVLRREAGHDVDGLLVSAQRPA